MRNHFLKISLSDEPFVFFKEKAHTKVIKKYVGSLVCLVTCMVLTYSPSFAQSSSSTKNASVSASAKANVSGDPIALTVSTTQVSQQKINQKIVANGNVAAWQEASIGTEAMGLRIAQVHVNVGDKVKQGQVLVSFVNDAVRADLAQAKAMLAEAQAAAAEASANADRGRALQPTGAISKQQYGQFILAEQTAQARVSAAQAAVQVQAIRLKNTQVFAPDSGLISARTATVGAVVSPGVELFRMVRKGRLEWRAEVPATDLAQIKIGGDVHIFSPNGTSLKGKVRSIAPTVDMRSRMGLVYVDVHANQGDEHLKAGMFTKGEFLTGTNEMMVVPQQAIVVRDGFNYAFKLAKDNRVSQVKVQVGSRIRLQDVDWVEIKQGLQLKDSVVVNGAGFLNEGDKVKLAQSVSAVAASQP